MFVFVQTVYLVKYNSINLLVNYNLCKYSNIE